tara:strand:- start:167 stop:364 length:198 start_codon:yes stop_codon:yes gene_type:complete
MNLNEIKCIEGGHKINPEFSNDGSKGFVRCVTCGLVYMDSENPKYSMKLMKKLRIYNTKEVTTLR